MRTWPMLIPCALTISDTTAPHPCSRHSDRNAPSVYPAIGARNTGHSTRSGPICTGWSWNSDMRDILRHFSTPWKNFFHAVEKFNQSSPTTTRLPTTPPSRSQTRSLPLKYVRWTRAS